MFQFEPIEPTLERDAAQRDVVLYVPDEILVVDRRENAAWRVNYDFSWTVAGASKILETKDLRRGGALRVRHAGAGPGRRAGRLRQIDGAGQGGVQVRQPVRGRALAKVGRRIARAAVVALPVPA